jgi:hypothetical protein
MFCRLKSGSYRIWQRNDLPSGSNMHGLKSGPCRFWQRTDLPPGSNMLRAEIQRALRRAPRQLRGLRLGLQTRRGSNHSAAHIGESNSRSNIFSFIVYLFACPAVVCTLYCLKWATSVEIRHWLPISEARRCSACANPLACPAVGKFSRASSAGGRRLLQ